MEKFKNSKHLKFKLDQKNTFDKFAKKLFFFKKIFRSQARALMVTVILSDPCKGQSKVFPMKYKQAKNSLIIKILSSYEGKKISLLNIT